MIAFRSHQRATPRTLHAFSQRRTGSGPRSDHLGGKLTPDKFAQAKNATHDDILFSPTKTPEVHVPQVRMYRDGRPEIVIEDYRPSAYLRKALAG